MAFLHQLRLLLWKNGLAVIRQPLWSLTLIGWPLVIFIIIAVTRRQFPPIVRPPCFVGPRNLPSTGFFPFLQTLMCNTDSHCHNTSRLVDPALTRSSQTTSGQRSPAAKLFQGEEILNFPLAAGETRAAGALLGFLEDITGLHQGGRHHNASLVTFNTTLLEDNETLHAMLESVNMLKQAICPMMLPKISKNQTARPLSFAMGTFCTTDKTMLEVSLNTLNQVLMEMMLTRPDQLATLAGTAVVVFDQLQNQTSLWESLLAIPELFHSGSADEVLDNAENLLTNLQSTLTAIQNRFPETEAPLSAISPIFAISLSVIHYAQNWPGRGVLIPLGELVKVEDDFLSEMVQKVLYGVHIPLDKVIALSLDPDTLNGYVCNNSDNPLWLTAACSSGTVRTLFDWVDSNKAAKQSLLAWSKHVAPHDLSFAKWLLNSLMGEISPGGPGGAQTPRTRRSVETQPQNIDEELFLWVGEVVLEILRMIPEADQVVRSVLRSGFQSMEIATLSLETLGGIMDSVLKDADHLKQTFHTLASDAWKASAWISDVLDSGVEAVLMIVASEGAACEDVLSLFEWLLNSEAVPLEVLRSAICGSDADLQQALLTGLMPLLESAQDFNSTITGQAQSNVSLPVILSEWQRLNHVSQQLLLSLDRLAVELGGAYWMNWMPGDCTHDVTGTLQQSVFLFMVKLGGRLERSQLWCVVKNYVHMADWVLNYQPGVSAPLNCSVDVYTADVCCHIEKPLNWSQFLTSVTQTLMNPDQQVLVNSLKGAVNLLQHVYSDALNSVVGSFLEHNIHGGEVLTHFLINMVHNLQDFVGKISILPDENFTDPNHVGALVSNLLQSSGLSPLLPLLFGDGPLNVSTVLHVATEFLKQNQLIFTSNETDPTMLEVEQLIKHFLSLEGNLTMSLSNFMGHSLISFVGYFNPDDVAQIMELIRPFTSQTSAGIVQAVIRVMELLRAVTDAPDGDPTNILLGYIHQLQNFAASLFRLRRVQKYMLPNGELNASQITDLHFLTKEFLDLLSPEGLQGLISAGPDAARSMVALKLIHFLPAEAQQEAARLLQDFRVLQHHVAKLAAGQDCLTGISEIFAFLNQILDTVLTANANVAIQIAVPNFLHMDQEDEEIACILFPLLLPPNEAGYVKTFKQALHFVKLTMATPNITISGVHDALQQSNLTLEELNNLASLFGAVDTDDLMVRLMDVINSQKCFEPHQNQMVTAQCVLGLVRGVTHFLTQLPGVQNETTILNLIPLIVNTTIKDVAHVDFTNPNAAVVQTLNRTLANVKMGLQVKQLSTPEIRREIKVLEGLIHLATDPEPFDDIFNSTMTENPISAQKIYLEMIAWYLKRLENVISSSSLSELLHPFFKLTQMQVSLQLAQTDFTLFVSRQIEKLLHIFQHPINSAGVEEIGQIALEMFQHLFQLIKGTLDFQNNIPGVDPLFDPNILHAVEFQMKQYLDATQDLLEQPNFLFLLASMLSSANSSIDPQKCFEPHQNQMGTAQCVLGLVSGVTSLLTQMPGGQNEAVLSQIPLIVNSTIKAVTHVDFTNPNAAVSHVLNTTMANVKVGLQQANQSTEEIMGEIRVLESLIALAADPEPFNTIFNSTLAEHPTYAQKMYLDMINWFLKEMQSIIKDSSLSDVLHPFLYVTQRQVSLQLVQTEFTLFVSNQIQQLMGNIQHPISGAGVGKIGDLAVEMFQRLLQLVKGELELQNNIPGVEPFLNTTVLHAVELQIEQNLERIQKWMNQPVVSLILANMLQWGNPYINVSSPFTDLHQLLETMFPLFNAEQLTYLSIIRNITHFLSSALQASEQPCGFHSDQFTAAIMEAIQNCIKIVTAATRCPAPPNLEQNILDVVNNSLKLILQQDMNFDSSRIISIHILEAVERIIQQILPEVSEYLLPGIKIVTTYFESSLVASGPENWNQLILNEMKTVLSLLPPNSPARVHVSTLINVTVFILESGRGNMSLWSLFESASAGSIPMIIGKMGKLLDMLWPIITGHPGPSLQDFVHLVPVLEQVATGMAGQDTWDELENIVEASLSLLKGTELWETVSSLVPPFEKIIESLVKNMQAENAMVLSLQGSMVTLVTEIVHTVNSSRCNLTEVSESIQAAVEHTVQAVQQANGTLECSAALQVWGPVGEAVGLSHQAMTVWCSTEVQPVLDAYYDAQMVYSNLNMSHMNMGAMTVDATAERIVKTLQSIYQVSWNRSYVAQDLISAFSGHLSALTGRPLSAEAQRHWLQQLHKMQMLSSLSSLRTLTDGLLMAAPSLQPYIEAVEKAARHVLSNYREIQDSGSSEDVFEEAIMIFLHAANITSDNIFSTMKATRSLMDDGALTSVMRQAARRLMKVFEDVPMAFHGLEHFLESIDLTVVMERLAEMVVWLASTEAYAMDLLAQTLPELYHVVRPLTSAFYKALSDVQAHMGLFEDLADNLLETVKQFVSSGGLLGPENYYHSMYGQEIGLRNHTKGVRRKRDAPRTPAMNPVDDFIYLFLIDYHSMFRSLSEAPSPEDIMGTVHSVFANRDLNIVVKGVTRDMPWILNTSREDTIDAAVEMLSFLTLPRMFDMSAVEILQRAADLLPDGFPFALIKRISSALTRESQENLRLMEKTIETAAELLQTNMSDPGLQKKLDQLSAQLCSVEETETVHMLMSDMKPGFLCFTLMPLVRVGLKTLTMNSSAVVGTVFETVIGDPRGYNVNSNWTTMLSQGLSFNISNLNFVDVDVSPPGAVTVGEVLRDEANFIQDVQQHMNFDPAALRLLMDTPLPESNLMMLTWLVSLRHCNSRSLAEMEEKDATMYNSFCTMSVDDWFIFSVLMARHLHTEKVIYEMVLPEQVQGMMGVMLQVVALIDRMARTVLPAIGQLQSHLSAIEGLDLMADKEFHQMSKGLRSTLSTKATFVTLSRALCSNGILALFGISKLPLMADDSSPSSPFDQKKEDMIQRFKIPRDASPFCMNMYLDMVNTTGGAIAWAFLKPMLMGQILFTPDTPVTRDIMKKSNATLEELANLRKHSREWLDSSHYILKSAEILSYTLPMLQNSLGNSFVKKFIEMQTDINVDTMKETLSNFSNMTLLLERNKQILNQITTLSTLMVNLSSCIKFDRYRGYNSAEELDADAQKLAKDRNLYASVIFKLPKDSNSSRKRREATSSLPPKVSYTIRMHMDNVMRTDRVRTPFYIKYHHISAKMTMRYNRGFIYMQENIDRAIISAHAGQTVTEPAVQLQPFPYPCHHRDEYLESISYVFPLMLMLAWVLFVADFVKRLVYERELRLHEYMKMMGVDPLSHFFAWFIECALYLLLTIFILTLVLKYGAILPSSDGFLLFLYLCDYGFSILAFSFLVSSFFDKTFIAGLSGSLLYILFFFPFIVVMAVESNLTFTQKSILSLFSPSCFSYASQYISRYEAQTEGIQWSNSYKSPITGDEASFGWLCWLMLLDSILYFLIGAYIRMVFPGKYGIPAPWYFPFKASFWAELCCCATSDNKTSRGLLFANIMQKNPPVFFDDKGKGRSALSSQDGEDFSHLPVGVTLHGLSKLYGDRVAIQNLNVSFYEGHVTSLLGHNGAGKTTTMSLLTGLFAPTSGSIEVYGRDMQTHIDDVRKELGVCMQYDVLFDHMTAKEHLLLYGQIKAPHWSKGELREQIRTILEETGMYAHRHKRVGTLSGGMKRKLSISIAFIGGSRLVVLDEPTTGVDPCSRRSIWDIIIQYKKHRTIIMSTHHLDEAEVLSDRITFLERGGLKCCGSPFHLKDKLGQGYKLTLTKKLHNLEVQIDSAELKSFIQAHVPEARLREAQGGDLVYSLPPFNSANASSYRSLLTALDSNLDTLQLGGYGVSDTTLEEVFLQLAQDDREPWDDDTLPSVSEKVSDTRSVDSFPSDTASLSSFSDNIKLTGSTMVSGVALAWQQLIALLMKRFHHSRRDWKGLISQILLPVLFMAAAMGLGCIKSDLQHYPELELSPALYRYEPSYSFFSNHNPKSEQLIDAMLSSPGIDNECLNNPVCSRSTGPWRSSGNSSKAFRSCKCTRKEQICESDNYQPPHRRIPSSQILYNLSGINVENYLVSTANDFIRNRYGGFAFGMPLPRDLKMDIQTVPKNRTVSKVWFNPEGHHTMPAYLNSINNLILRANLPADKDPRKYAISVSSHPYFGRPDDEDTIVQGLLQILVAMCVMTGYSITTASFAIYVVSEHHTGSKRLQHIAGVSELFYWVVNFGYDMVVYMIPVVLTVAVVAAFQVPAFTYRQNLAAVTLLLVLFGFSTFPWMYLLSGMFKDAEMAFITFVCINLFISVNTIMSTSILYFLSQLSSINPELVLAIFHRLCKAFLIFPQFSFGHGLMQLARKNIEVQILSGYGVDAYINPFSMEGLGWLFISSIIQGVVLFSLRLLLNKFIIRRVRRLICGGKTVPHVSHEEEDEDVATEHQRVASGAAGSDILQVNQLTKVYQSFSKKVQAVKRVSVGIPAGECFGLLGVNGAGKTTTFKMLTGDVSPTAGTAQIRDQDGRLVDIMACRNQGINIGYCPQVDALDNLLTGEEHLYFYARIRGISKREIDRVVRYLLRRLELHYHRNITTDGYSCGTRRKLSTALALIGNPQILLLDEPSSGMDPRTKRHLWKIISEEVKGKCAVVLTSHSMEECEALCSRLAIMVKGQFRCLGSLQHIKNRFGSGFTVKMYLAGASCDAEAITGFMQRRFPSTYLKDQHSNMVEFHVPVAPGGVADIFDQLESNKSALQIKHFSVSQTTLDEVFINFAMEKTDNMENISINHEDGSDSDSVSSISAAAT